jgi:hypothetical protein
LGDKMRLEQDSTSKAKNSSLLFSKRHFHPPGFCYQLQFSVPKQTAASLIPSLSCPGHQHVLLIDRLLGYGPVQPTSGEPPNFTVKMPSSRDPTRNSWS